MFLQDGIEGLCNARYTIPDSMTANRMLVMKAKNLNECPKRVEKIVGATYAVPCTECKEVSQVVALPASTTMLCRFWEKCRSDTMLL